VLDGVCGVLFVGCTRKGRRGGVEAVQQTKQTTERKGGETEVGKEKTKQSKFVCVCESRRIQTEKRKGVVISGVLLRALKDALHKRTQNNKQKGESLHDQTQRACSW